MDCDLAEAVNDTEEHEDIIYGFNRYLNAIGYKRDNQEKEIKSHYFDVEHIIYARVCNFFISHDQKLQHRAQLTYKILGLPTQVCSAEEFIHLTS